MLAATAKPTADFHALARYLLHGKRGTPSPDRVAWVAAQNLPTDDVLLAAELMAAAAGRNAGVTKPVYHLIIAWAPSERASPEQMEAIARETLHRAGLGEHQAFIVGHGDTPHDHLHMMVNRVHPDTGRVWQPRHDWRLFDRIMRELADAHGFAHQPAHAFNPEETRHARRKPNSAATYAAKRGHQTDRPQWSRAEAETYGARLSEHLDATSTWDDLAQLIAEDGLTLTPKGRGYVVGDATAYVKLSALGLSRTAKGLRARPPARRQSIARPWFAVDEVDIAKGLSAWGLVGPEAVRDAIANARDRRLARMPRHTPMMQRLLASTMFQRDHAIRPVRSAKPTRSGR